MLRSVEIETLALAAQTGDQRASHALAHWLCETLAEYLSRCFAKPDADELRQRTILVVVRDLHVFEDRGPGSFLRWVVKIANFEARTLEREPLRERANLARLAEQPLSSELSPGSVVFMLEIQGLLDECVPLLDPLEREALLWAQEGGDDRVLAAHYGVTVEAIRSRRHRGRQALIELMREGMKTPVREADTQDSPSSERFRSS